MERFHCTIHYAGAVVALLGRELESGWFEVEDHTFAGLAPQTIETHHTENEGDK